MRKAGRFLALLMICILTLGLMPISSTPVNAQQRNTPQAHIDLQAMLRSSDFERLFGDYTAFTINWLDSVDLATVLGHALSGGLEDAVRRGATFLTSGFSGLEQEVMNNQNKVNQLVRNVVNEMFGNGSTISTSNFTSTTGIAAKLVDMIGGDVNLKASLDLIQYIAGAGSAIDRVLHEYEVNITMLMALRDLHSAQLWRDTINGVIYEYQRSVLSSLISFAESSLRNYVLEGVVAFSAKPIVLVSSVLDLVLRNVDSISGLQTMITSNDINVFAMEAFRNAATRIANGNLTGADVVNYQAAFYLARGLQIVRYEAKKGQFPNTSREFEYINFQLRNLRYMSHDSFIYSRPFAGFSPTTASAMTPTLYVVTRDNAPVRPRQYENSGQHRTLPIGTQITVNGIAHNTHGNRWYRVSGLSGVSGAAWIWSGNVERTTQQQPRPATPQPAQPPLTVIDSAYGEFIIAIPANFRVDCFTSATSRTVSTWISGRGEAFTLFATRRVTLSNGSTRYFFRSGDGLYLYFEFTDRMSVENHVPALARIDEVTVHFNSNGGDITPAPVTVPTIGEGNSVWISLIPPASPQRLGHHFRGWTVGNNPNNSFVRPSTTISVIEHGANITLYAQWGVGELGSIIQVHYDALGGTGAPASHTAIIDEHGFLTVYPSTDIPSKPEYLFYGWRTEDGMPGFWVWPGQEIRSANRFIAPPSADFSITLNAHWVHYDWFIENNRTPPHGQQLPTQGEAQETVQQPTPVPTITPVGEWWRATGFSYTSNYFASVYDSCARVAREGRTVAIRLVLNQAVGIGGGRAVSHPSFTFYEDGTGTFITQSVRYERVGNRFERGGGGSFTREPWTFSWSMNGAQGRIYNVNNQGFRTTGTATHTNDLIGEVIGQSWNFTISNDGLVINLANGVVFLIRHI